MGSYDCSTSNRDTLYSTSRHLGMANGRRSIADPMADAVSQTIAAITTFLGVLLGISTYSYNKSQAAETAAQTKTKKTSGNGKAKS